MRRAGLSTFVAAALLVPALPARADDAGSRTTLFGAQFALAGGAWFATPNAFVDHELARAGWGPLPHAVPDAAVRFGLTVHDVTLDLHFAGIDAGLHGPPGESGTLSRKAIGVDLGTRIWRGHGFALAPFVGVGTLETTLCFTGRPSASSAPSASAFAQIAMNPAGGTCLAALAPVLDVGLSVPWVHGFRPRDAKGGEALQTTLSFGPKVGYSLRLTGGRTWTPESDGEPSADLPAFRGPSAPIGGAYAGLELQFTVGVVRGNLGR